MSIVKVRSGETINVRTGVMRGIGPQGPIGPVGPKGATGATGPAGPTGLLNDIHARLSSTGSVTTSQSGWVPVGFEVVELNQCITVVDAYTFKVNEAGTYLAIINAKFEEVVAGGTSAGQRSIRMRNTSTNSVLFTVQTAAVTSDPTIVNLTQQIDVTSSLHVYTVEAFSDDGTAVALTTRSLKLMRVGSGPAGVAGPIGPVGPGGIQGPTGPVGNASGGFTDNDSIMPSDQAGGTKLPSEGAPGGTAKTTADQAAPYPAGTQRPATPYAFKTALEWLEKRIIARYASATDRNTKRPTRSVGEMYYLTDTGYLQVRNYTGGSSTLAAITGTALVDRAIGQVVVTTTTPDTSKFYSPGTLFLQV